VKLRALAPILLAFGCASSAMIAPASAQRGSGTASAAARSPADCAGMYQSGRAPVVAGTASPVRVFCHLIYVAGYSTARLNPLWSAQHLTRAAVRQGDSVFRADRSTFAPEPDLRPGEQAADSDFDHNDWDKGHLAPANDAPDTVSQIDTFFLSNAVPQHFRLNRYMWAYLEGSVHQLAALHGDVYIVTGPIFGPRPDPMNDRVPIPSHTYKAVYIPALGVAVGFIASNQAVPTCRIVSIAEITRQSGVNPFPGLSAAVRARQPAITLPRGIIMRSNGTQQRQPLPNCH
jgi:endonuclease G